MVTLLQYLATSQPQVPFNILHFWLCFFGFKKDIVVNIFVSDYLLQNFAQTFAMQIKINITLYTRAINVSTKEPSTIQGVSKKLDKSEIALCLAKRLNVRCFLLK